MQFCEENGRSMIEMLGVLAIVGILSIGAILGFGRAMRTYKNIKMAEEYALFVRGIVEHGEKFMKMAQRKGAQVNVNSIINAMGILPYGWAYQTNRIYDSVQGVSIVTANPSYFTINYALHSNFNSMADYKEYCRMLIIYAAQPHQDSLSRLWLHRYGESEQEKDSFSVYGSRNCRKGSRCLSSITVEDMAAFCDGCSDYQNCTLVFTFK